MSENCRLFFSEGFVDSKGYETLFLLHIFLFILQIIIFTDTNVPSQKVHFFKRDRVSSKISHLLFINIKCIHISRGCHIQTTVHPNFLYDLLPALNPLSQFRCLCWVITWVRRSVKSVCFILGVWKGGILPFLFLLLLLCTALVGSGTLWCLLIPLPVQFLDVSRTWHADHQGTQCES